MVIDPGKQSKNGTRLVTTLLSLLVSVSIFIYLFSKISLVEVGSTLKGISTFYAVLFVAFSLVMSLCRTWRYNLTLIPAGYYIPPGPLFLITLVRNFFSDLLPARLGTLIYIYLIKRRGVSLAAATASFSLCFVFDIFALAFFIIAAVAVVRPEIISTPLLLGGSVLLGVMSGVFLFGLPFFLETFSRIIQRCTFLSLQLRDRLQRLLSSLQQDISIALGRKVFWKIFWLSVILRGCKYLSLYALFLALVLPLKSITSTFPLPSVFLGLCSAEMAASLPISGIAGFGVYEGAWSLVFQLLGYPEKFAVLIGVSHHLVTQVYGYSLGGMALLFLVMFPARKKGGNTCENSRLPKSRKFWLKFCLLAFVVVTGGFFLQSGGTANGKTSTFQGPESEIIPGRSSLENGLSDRIQGWLVYQRPDGIYKVAINSRQSKRLTENGYWPRWSPDGEKIAFVREQAIMVMSADGRDEYRLTGAKKARAVCFHPDGQRVLFIDGKKIQEVHLLTKEVQTILEGEKYLELDITTDGRQLVTTVKTVTGYFVKRYQLDTGQRQTVSRGCSASISPTGKYITVNGNKHRFLHLYQGDSLLIAGRVSAPDGNTFDNQYWSNHPDWLVSTSERGGNNIFIHQVSTDTAFQMTTSNDCDRGDLFILAADGS